MYLAQGAWHPTGIKELEPAALAALRAGESCCVVAGPGAGKTELLAQRAAFLFQTGLCRDPYRILAISFKKDAALNLARRVGLRCSASQAARFTSMTFDAFTKSLLDRFIVALPELWAVDKNYHVSYASRGDVRRFLGETARLIKDPRWKREVSDIDAARFEAEILGPWRLPLTQAKPASGIEYALICWWIRYAKIDSPALTFTMINRLAEVLQRFRPEIGRALRLTYPYVFIDEAQDTTYAQYDFLRSVFNPDSTVLTVVGDEKQRIMGWAGAQKDVFSKFVSDFKAGVISLRCNYRSSEELVKIQHVLARRLDGSAVDVESKAESRDISGDCAMIWLFESIEEEAAFVSKWIRADLVGHAGAPRDYALLVRQKASEFEEQLSKHFSNEGLQLRDESRRVGRSTVQDVLADPLTDVFRSLWRLASRERDPQSWINVEKSVMLLRGVDPDDEGSVAKCRRIENLTASFVAEFREGLDSLAVTRDNCSIIVTTIVDFLDRSAIAEVFPEYRSEESADIALEAIEAHLADSAMSSRTWPEAFDVFDGVDSIPLLTVHKSKGLEFDTVLFLGIDDENWWSYRPGDLEGLATFFVGLSRAKIRANFTYCSNRGGRERVGELLELLKEAGVAEVSRPELQQG